MQNAARVQEADYESIGTEATREEVMYKELQKVIDAGIDPFNH